MYAPLWSKFRKDPIMKTKRIFSLLLSAICLLAAVFPGSATASAVDVMPEFTDVTETHPHYAAIMFCADNKFVNGKSATTFAPDEALTREQMALIWARTFHVKRTPHTFKDVVQFKGGEAEMAIIVLHGLGILNGVSPTEYGRFSAITREQAIAIAARTYLPYDYEGDDADKYEDADKISDWAYEAISKTLKAGELNNVFTGDKLFPQNPITRGELCHIVYNIMGGDEIPTPSPTPSPSPSPSPEASPTPSPSPSPEASPTPVPSPEPSPTPEPSPEPSPTASPAI